MRELEVLRDQPAAHDPKTFMIAAVQWGRHGAPGQTKGPPYEGAMSSDPHAPQI